MTGYVTTCGGTMYELPVLYEWEMTYTGGVPCDSFSVRCAYEKGMAEVLRQAVRFTAKENGSTAFYGVVDEYESVCGPEGLWLEINGRGMAALLLDNEAEPSNYQWATTGEILRNHVLPYGIRCQRFDALNGSFYSVESGSSEWRALSDFTRFYGGFEPYFTKDGTLILQSGRAQARRTLDERAAVTGLRYRDRRYGVLSEAVVVDRKTRARTVVRNEPFAARGGRRRSICFVPNSTLWRWKRYTGEYQIAQSKRDCEQLRVTLMGSYAADAQDRMSIQSSALGVTGEFTVSEVTRRLSAAGEETILTLRRE